MPWNVGASPTYAHFGGRVSGQALGIARRDEFLFFRILLVRVCGLLREWLPAGGEDFL
ncbi:MAG: hypothetical protein HW389_1736 [Bacteroidetes bacterium]|nr:hypothetical protein [Bacteroidota bacterium]